VAEDGLTWTFNLRSGVKFHDGTDFTADAVKFTFERLVDPDAGFLNAGLFASVIASVDVVDPLTVNIVTTRPFGPFLNYLAHFSAGIVSPAAVNQQGNAFGLNPVGTGAYTVTAVDAGQSVTLQRNDDYWGDAPASEQITFRSITDDNTRVAAVQSGQVGIGTGLPVQSIEALEADGMTVTIIKGMQAQYVGINTTRPQLSNPAIRQALNYAIDTASISEGLFFGANEPLQSVFTEGTFGYQAQATSYDFDQAKAVALLAGAGITADNPLHLVLWAPQGLYPQDSLLAQAIQSQLAEVNVEVEIVQQQSSNYFTVLKEQSDYDLFLWAFVPSTGDGYQTLQNNVLSNTGDTPDYFNFMRYSNPDLDELINRAGTETDQDQRRSDLQAAQEIIWNDAPYIFLYNIGIVTGSRPDVQGVEALPIGYLSLSGTHQ
jgi:peptide/nickel transport system substrate-binding protein